MDSKNRSFGTASATTGAVALILSLFPYVDLLGYFLGFIAIILGVVRPSNFYSIYGVLLGFLALI